MEYRPVTPRPRGPSTRPWSTAQELRCELRPVESVLSTDVEDGTWLERSRAYPLRRRCRTEPDRTPGACASYLGPEQPGNTPTSARSILLPVLPRILFCLEYRGANPPGAHAARYSWVGVANLFGPSVWEHMWILLTTLLPVRQGRNGKAEGVSLRCCIIQIHWFFVDSRLFFLSYFFSSFPFILQLSVLNWQENCLIPVSSLSRNKLLFFLFCFFRGWRKINLKRWVKHDCYNPLTLVGRIWEYLLYTSLPFNRKISLRTRNI